MKYIWTSVSWEVMLCPVNQYCMPLLRDSYNFPWNNVPILYYESMLCPMNSNCTLWNNIASFESISCPVNLVAPKKYICIPWINITSYGLTLRFMIYFALEIDIGSLGIILCSLNPYCTLKNYILHFVK